MKGAIVVEKKTIILISASLIFIFVFAITGCGNNATKQNAGNNTTKQDAGNNTNEAVQAADETTSETARPDTETSETTVK
ncbi:MAG: hypothetical protein FJW61_08190 [Actinobacteria bacterium]|nr:hypothetical protein [Actinomycetota bacterium]